MSTPELNLPPSQGHTVKVSIINGAISHMPSHLFVQPTIKGHDNVNMACFSFLIESPHKGQKFLFDLAFMKNLGERMPPALKALFSGGNSGGIDSVHDVPDTLTAHNLPLSSINAIIWSHTHIDHVGDPAVFPPSTDLIVGPGVRAKHMPGYPADPSAFLLDSAFHGRNVREIDFSKSVISIGGFRAIDYFEDASFYLLDGVGHTMNHMCGLARLADDSFILMAGDACHHVGQLRPSEFLPLPDHIPSGTLQAPANTEPTCSCARFKPLLPAGETSPFYGLAPGMHENHEEATETVRKLKVFDAREDVFVVIAHDKSLLDVVRFYPETLDGWKERGWGVQGRWRFLGDFEGAVGRV